MSLPESTPSRIIRAREKHEEEIFRRESGLCVAIICNPSPKNSFLIGSHGLAIVQSRHPDDAVTRSWLPIAHDVAVLATSFPDRESPVLLIQAPVEGLQVVATASPCVRYSAANCAMRSGSRPLPQNNPGFDPCQRAAGDLHAAGRSPGRR